jgi:lipid II:glycine glycyltransferase (peptidoglycan interpeptide bridge formation enzyme)
MIKILDPGVKPEEFNIHAQHPLQSWQWGEARRKLGVEVVRIGEYDDNGLKNVYQLSLHQIPLTPFKLGYLPRSVMPTVELLDFLYDWSLENKVIFIKMEPYENVKREDELTKDPRVVKSGHPLFTPWTQVLDIREPEDALLAKMHHKTRYNIRLAVKKGVTVREANDAEGFETFSKLYFETARRQKYYGHNYEYHKTVWESLKKDVARLLIAYYGDVPLAAYELFYFKNKLYYVYGGTSNLHRNLMASNLLMWEAIKLGKRLGAEVFDMWGSLPPGYDQTNVWAGFTRFKEGYATNFMEMVGSHDLVINPVLYRIYSLLYKVREFVLNLKQKFS